MSDGGTSSGQVPEHFVQGEGLAVRLADGTIYFFRKEILDACEVTEEDSLNFVKGALEGTDEVSGFGFNLEEPSVQVVSIEGKLQPSSGLASIRHQSTIMCAW